MQKANADISAEDKDDAKRRIEGSLAPESKAKAPTVIM